MTPVVATSVLEAQRDPTRSWWARIASAIARFFGRPAASNDLTVIPVRARSLAHPRRYQEILWTAEQVESRGVLVDLTQVQRVHAALFEALAVGWSSQRVEKLGVRVSFKQWARLYRTVAPHQRCLERKGVRFMLFYDAQDFRAWFRDDRVVHEPEAVIQRLGVISELAMYWPTLLDATVTLLDGYGAHERAESLVKLSQLALDCGVERKALDFAHDALSLDHVLSPKLLCRAKRLMGEALLHLDQYEYGARFLEKALEDGREAGAREEAARAAFALGSSAACCDEHALAVSYQQQALRLLPREPSELAGRVHAALATAFHRLGKHPEGDAHREMSREMRMVSAVSYSAERERLTRLLSYLPKALKSRASE